MTVAKGESFGPDLDACWLLRRHLDAQRALSARSPPEDGVCVRISPEFGNCETRQLCRVKLSRLRVQDGSVSFGTAIYLLRILLKKVLDISLYVRARI